MFHLLFQALQSPLVLTYGPSLVQRLFSEEGPDALSNAEILEALQKLAVENRNLRMMIRRQVSWNVLFGVISFAALGVGIYALMILQNLGR